MSMQGHEVLAVLDQIAATSSRTEKAEILGRHIDDPLMKKVVTYAYDPFITFGIKPPKAIGDGSQALTIDSKVWTLLDGLAARTITGGEAQTLVREWLLDVLDAPSSQVLWRVLSKDLRAGFTDNTVNRVLPGTIPSFDVMLAHKHEEKRIKAFPVAVEPKLDGLRTIGLVRGFTGGFFSRTGKPFPALAHLVEPVGRMLDGARAAVQNPVPGLDERLREAYWRMLGGDGNPCLAIDAEATAGSFNKTSGDVRRKSQEATDSVLNVIDILPYVLFTGDRTELGVKYAVRRKFAEFVVAHAPADAPIRIIERYLGTSHDEVQAYYQRFRDRGLEGAIVKPLDGIYEKKRSYGWLKLKNEETVDVRITDAYEGEGKYEGMLGGVIVDLDGVAVRVGGGYSDQQRVEFWAAWQEDRAHNDPGELRGRLIEVEYHEKTPDGSLRHPRFVRFRDDKDDSHRMAA